VEGGKRKPKLRSPGTKCKRLSEEKLVLLLIIFFAILNRNRMNLSEKYSPKKSNKIFKLRE
jgi:hypothetical protein